VVADFEPWLEFLYSGLDYLGAGLDDFGAGLDLLYSGLDYFGAGLDFLYSGLDYFGAGLDFCSTGLDYFSPRLDYFSPRLDYIGPGHLKLLGRAGRFKHRPGLHVCRARANSGLDFFYAGLDVLYAGLDFVLCRAANYASMVEIYRTQEEGTLQAWSIPTRVAQAWTCAIQG